MLNQKLRNTFGFSQESSPPNDCMLNWLQKTGHFIGENEVQQYEHSCREYFSPLMYRQLFEKIEALTPEFDHFPDFSEPLSASSIFDHGVFDKYDSEVSPDENSKKSFYEDFIF